FELALRIPGWCDLATVYVNGKHIVGSHIQQGYLILAQQLVEGDIVELKLSMPISMMKCHPYVRQNAGKTAIQRGPLVYCLEEVDNGEHLHQLLLSKEASFELYPFTELGSDMLGIKAQGYRRTYVSWNESLYRRNYSEAEQPVQLSFI